MKNIRSILLPALAIFVSSLTAQTPTTDSVITQLNAIAAEQAQLATNIKALQASAAALVAQNATLTTTNGTLTTANGALTTTNTSLTADNSTKAATITSLQAQNTALTAQVADLQAQLSSSGQINAALQKALDDLKAASKANADLLGGTTTSPPTTGDAATLAELSDNTLAGVNKRLGPTAPDGMVLPTVWERPQAPTTDTGYGKAFMPTYSEGLSITTTVAGAKFDYGSTEDNIIGVADDPLTITGVTAGDNYNTATVNAGVGVYRVRSEEHSNGAVQIAPVKPYNGQSIPDRDAIGHVRYGMKDKLGRPVAAVRAKINRYDAGMIAYGTDRGGDGYVGTIGTQTAQAPWSGTKLPSGKIPLSIALTSQNEFLLVGVHDVASGKGQILVYWLWAGNDLQQKEAGKSFPPDFPKAHPGLITTGVITGMKLFGAVDLPIKYPTSLECVNFAGAGTRISGPDGNASYLNIWPIDTDVQRTAFLAKNGTWIPSWGKACVTSRKENKLVTVDFTALFAGVRDQYFGSQANYDQTSYTTAGGGNGWNAYDLNDPMKFPWGVEAKPAWAPVVSKVINLPAAPNHMLMSERGDAEIAVASADGYVRFYKWVDGSEDGSVKVGDNPVHLCYDKSGGQRAGGLFVTCRASRSVVRLNKWGVGSAVTLTLQDDALVDPVAAVCLDTHGLQFPGIGILDFNGKAYRTYRYGDLKLNTQGGAVFPVGPAGASPVPLYERGGSFNLPARPYGIADSNVN